MPSDQRRVGEPAPDLEDWPRATSWERERIEFEHDAFLKQAAAQIEIARGLIKDDATRQALGVSGDDEVPPQVMPRDG